MAIATTTTGESSTSDVTATTTTTVAAAALNVLAQRALVSFIASFQRGPPGVVTPLLQRLLRDGLVGGHVRPSPSRWEPWKESRRISTPVYANVQPKRAWAERVTPEAIARFDTQDLHALRTVVAATAFTFKPARATRRLLHGVTEAATACGRVDMLRWLHEQHHVFAVEPLLGAFCVKLAMRHGQLAVLEWLETTFSGSVLEPLRGYTVRGVVKRGTLRMVRWLADRSLGAMPAGAAFMAVAQHDAAMLREVLAFPAPTTVRASTRSFTTFASIHALTLARLASALNQPDALQCIIQHNWAFPIELLHVAITRRDRATVQCMLDHLHNARPEAGGAGNPAQWIVSRVVRADDAPMLERIAHVESGLLKRTFNASVLMGADTSETSDATMRLLLRMSPVGDIATVVMRHAVRGEKERVATLLALANDRPLPHDALGFIHRVTTDTLGPVASLARTYHSSDASGTRTPDAHLLATMAHWLPTATQQDVRDLVLHLLSESSRTALQRVLNADAAASVPHCDGAFLELCLSLRSSVYYTEHQVVAWVLRQRARQGVVESGRWPN